MSKAYQTAIGLLCVEFVGAPSLLRLLRSEYPKAPTIAKGRRVVIHLTTEGYDERMRRSQYFSSPETLIAAVPKRFLLVGMFRSKIWEVRVKLAPHHSDRDTLGYVVQPLLSALLNRLQAVVLHASAVTKKGRAFAFLGKSGSGKSTTAFLLSRSGFAMAEDDRLALFKRNEHFLFYPQPAQGYLTDKSLSLFPGLCDLKVQGRVKKGKRTKNEIAVDAKTGKPCLLTALFFPVVTNRTFTSVKPLTEKEALRRLKSFSNEDQPARFPDRQAVINHLSLSWSLAGTLPFYELRLGTDPRGVVQTVGAVTESLR